MIGKEQQGCRKSNRPGPWATEGRQNRVAAKFVYIRYATASLLPQKFDSVSASICWADDNLCSNPGRLSSVRPTRRKQITDIAMR